MTEQMDTDYLIIGSGAVGMAFADVILSETDADLILVDRHAKPGGHWNDAYPFVTLHQPSAFYGVSSAELSRGETDQIGLNAGLYDLATGAEVSAYFDHVMRQRFLPSGRVRYFPMCEYEGEGRFRCVLSGRRFEATARRKRVDATHLKTTVPSTHTPSFRIDPAAWFLPLNDLPKLRRTPEGYVVIGGGKTGIDACLWLLEHRVPPERIRWIMPRDAWLLDRANMQPGLEFFERAIGSVAAQMEAIAAAESIEDMFDRLEACGFFLRLDEGVRPKMFHGATISRAELQALRQIKGVVRLGRVTALERDRIRLDHGEIATSADHVHIDCSARAVSNETVKPIFEGDLITLQMVRAYQPVFSAGLIAHVEASGRDEAEQNRLCGVVPLPNHDTDVVRFTAAAMMNQFHWGQDPDLRDWLKGNRLDGFSGLAASLAKDDPRRAPFRRIRDTGPATMAKLQVFLAGLDQAQEAEAEAARAAS